MVVRRRRISVQSALASPPACKPMKPMGWKRARGSYASESATTDVKLDPLWIERSKPYLADTYETRSGPGVSGRGGAKYCWDVVVVLLLVLVLVLDPFGNGLHKLYFSITRTRTTTRTRNYLPGISGTCHSCLCTQTAPQGPLFPSAVSEKVQDLCHLFNLFAI
jgi:hypothetical protein